MMLQIMLGACSTFFKRRTLCELGPVLVGEVLVMRSTVPIPTTSAEFPSISLKEDAKGV